jgi:hypothetical protein
MRERLRDRIAHCLRVAFFPSQEDWAFATFPPRLSFLYYLLRPFRLLSKYVARAIGKSR